jgi:rod shape-determining protein MreB
MNNAASRNAPGTKGTAGVRSSVSTETCESLLVGFDWGTNTSCLIAAAPGNRAPSVHEQIPTVVGFVPEDVLDGVIPNNATILYGRDALRYGRHLNIVRPLRGGTIHDLPAATLFAQHLKGLLPAGCSDVRAVIGVPATSDQAARENARTAVQGVFDQVIFVPEPFLAAVGCRDETRLGEADYKDPVLNSLYVDIGAGSTDVCLVQGHYPTADDQLSAPFAGDAVDQIILEAAMATFPDSGLTLNRVREIKERHSYVLSEDASVPAIATVMVGGKPRKLNLTRQIGAGCEALLKKTFEMTRELIARADSESVNELLQNVIVTGGGSLIKGFGVALQANLLEEGFENVRVTVLGENYKDHVARGALKFAGQARERHWQTLIG